MIVAGDFYLLRTPLLPLNFLEQFDGLKHTGLNEKIKDIFMDAWLQEAVYIASPELFQEFQKWQQGRLTDKKEVNKLVLSLFRYLLRMCTRCTPYGLFAGCALGEFGTATQIELAQPGQYKKHCRLDMNYVAELVDMISLLPEIQPQLKYYPNNSLYKVADKYRYAEYTINNKFRSYDLTGVDCSVYLANIMGVAGQGATMADLAKSIVYNGITEEDATAFVKELVQHQVLVSELEPTITGEEFLTRLLHKLNTLKNTTVITEKLTRIQQVLQDQTTGIHKYLQIHSLVKALLPGTNSKDLVQTDLFLSAPHNTLDTKVIKDIQEHTQKLWPLVRLHDPEDLKNFRKAFTDRYDQQEIPLALALDAEAGVGYGGYGRGQADHTPLIDTVVAGNPNESNISVWDKIQDFQLKKLNACLLESSTEIEITDADLDELKQKDGPSVPDSLYLIGSILGKNAKAVDAGDFQFELNACAGPSAATLLGRFCHGDAGLTAKVKACLQGEEKVNPDCIFAEVVHLPQARTGNILHRPQLRDYEIVYVGNGSVPPDCQILLSDLMVSVRNNTVILRSKKLNKRIIPRLSSAHDFNSGSLPAYKFLCELQFQQLHSTLAWRWNMVKDASFLPRVRYGKIILSRCTWILNKKDFPELMKDNKNDIPYQYDVFLQRMRSQCQLPRYVVLVEGDNELFINLDNESCLHILADTLLKKERVVIQEVLNINRCIVEGNQGRYTNQIIVPFHKMNGIKKTVVNPVYNYLSVQKSIDLKRNFMVGSEWLYIKLYCGSTSAERILKEVIKPLTQRFIAENKIDKWFFIRYADPETHLRIRFHHSSDETFWMLVLESFHEMMKEEIDKGVVHKIQTDTYEREIERYGVGTMELSEDIFYCDSEAVIECIYLLEGEEGEKYRWLLALRGIDMLLGDFGYHEASKAALLKKLSQALFSEFGAGKNLQNQLNAKYREHMRVIESFLDYTKDAENGIEEAVAVFIQRSVRLKEAVKQIGQANQDKTFDIEALLPNYIHMFLNRMLLSNHRMQELVIYHFLGKYYESAIARRKQQESWRGTVIRLIK